MVYECSGDRRDCLRFGRNTSQHSEVREFRFSCSLALFFLACFRDECWSEPFSKMLNVIGFNDFQQLFTQPMNAGFCCWVMRLIMCILPFCHLLLESHLFKVISHPHISHLKIYLTWLVFFLLVNKTLRTIINRNLSYYTFISFLTGNPSEYFVKVE